jgi:Cof subfamily protein (haloacid dehalogenase superfamily)
MLPRILALDLDGTLLPNSKVLTPRSVEAVRAATEAGVRVVIATGKAFHLTARYAVELGLSGPVIALDGGMVRDGPEGSEMARVTVPADRASEVLDRLNGLDVSPFLTDGADRLIVDERLADWTWFLRVYATDIEIAARPLDATRGDPFFLALLGSTDEVRRGERELSDFASNGLKVFSAQFLDRDIGILVVRPRTDKGAALRRVATHCGVDRRDVTAIGDWKNDTAMIEWAGTGVAMPRSSPDVLAAADLVLPEGSEEDGVARYVERLLT